jgi:heme exporter protein C
MGVGEHRMKHLFATIGILILFFAVVFNYAPIEKTQGIVQKIFYIHVGSAITMYLGYIVGCITAIAYLIKKKPSYFWMSKASIEVAYVFTCAVLLTGPIWAKPIWGAYWTWEPRLTTTFVLWLMYTAYLIFQRYLKETHQQGQTLSCVVAIVASLNIPLIHFSVKLWRGVHPSVIRNEGGLPQSMVVTLLLGVIAMMVLWSYLFRIRYQLEKIQQQVSSVIEQQRSQVL